jgi:hypothetical protein
MAGQPARSDFDGAAIPLFAPPASTDQPWEHTNIEHWGAAASDGDGGFGRIDHHNNTYKALRIYSSNYSFFYSVWCNNDRELYDMQVGIDHDDQPTSTNMTERRVSNEQSRRQHDRHHTWKIHRNTAKPT